MRLQNAASTTKLFVCYVYEMQWKEKMTAQISQDIKPTVLQFIEHMNIEYQLDLNKGRIESLQECWNIRNVFRSITMIL